MTSNRKNIEEAFSDMVHPLAILGVHGNEAEKELANKIAGLILVHNRGDTQPAAIKLPPAPYVGPDGGYEFSSYEQGELQGRCDMWELIRKMNAVPCATRVTMNNHDN